MIWLLSFCNVDNLQVRKIVSGCLARGGGSPRPLNILITSFRLAERTASELFVRNLARLLCDGGGTVAVFTPCIGPLGDELRKEGIEVSDHPSAVSFQPDLIHGQGNLEAMAAILAHPGIPAVFLSHGGESWREQPPSHPRIRRYIGLTAATRNWLQRERGIAPDKVAALPQLIEPPSPSEIRKTPVKPATAIFCDLLPASGREELLLRRACEELHIRFEKASSLPSKSSVTSPAVLSRYDLVFASGKVALDALAAGCGVLPVGEGSFGDLVTMNNFEKLSARDFSGRRAIQPESILLAELVAEIESWDWCRLSGLASRVRKLHGEEALRERLREIYSAVLAEGASETADCRTELPEIADWILELAGQRHQLDLGYLELNQRASILRTEQERFDSQTRELSGQLEVEKEKVRFARRQLQEGNVLHQRLRTRIEEGWREIESRNGTEQSQSGETNRKSTVDLSG